MHREGERRDRDRHRAARARVAEGGREAEAEGVSVEVVDPRTLQPLDEEALVASVRKTNRCVVAHEAVARMGFGAEVAAVVQDQAFDWLDAPVERVGARFTPGAVRAGDGELRDPARRRRAPGDSPDGRSGRWQRRSSCPGSARAWSPGTITKWLKREGEGVAKGEPLYEVDTEKVTQEVEADLGGVLLRIAVPEGEVAVGETLGWIGQAGEEVEAPSGDGAAAAPRHRHPHRRSSRPCRPQPPSPPGCRRAARRDACCAA